MKEIREIVQAQREAERLQKQTALATVVHIEGSSYRQPGARMLVRDDGQLTGAISGGCLEGDALRKALLVMAEQKAMLVTYDTTDEEDHTLGVGLGCNGIIQILIEPVVPGEPKNPVALLELLLEKRRNAVVTTVFSLEDKKGFQPGTCAVLLENADTHERILPEYLKPFLLEESENTLVSRTSSIKTYTHSTHNYTAFHEWIAPAVSLVIIGAGNDIKPLVDMAAVLGWDTIVADGRSNYATSQRFPSACQVLIAKPEAVLDKIECDPQTAFVLMTHNFNYDLAMLRQLIYKTTPYIGILGPRKKRDKMLEVLQEDGIILSEEQLQKIYGPVGYDIGAETAEEIALSILTEIKGVFSGKKGNSLRNSPTTIHAQTKQKISQVRVPPIVNE